MNKPRWQDVTTNLLDALLQQGRTGLISDLDGTLSPIVQRPEDAQITPRNRALLEELHQTLALVAIVSGRAADDARARAGMLDIVYVGNHGLERWEDGHINVDPAVGPYRPALERAFTAAQQMLLEGMTIEDKGATLSIHYRRARDPKAAAEHFRPHVKALADEQGLRSFEGRMVFELRPPVEIDKGTSLTSLIQEYGLNGALFLGDDVTDTHAMIAARRLRASGVCFAVSGGVTGPETPHSVLEQSDFTVDGIQGVEALLQWLSNAARASAT